MLNVTDNLVKIEGILSEVDLQESSFVNRNGQTIPCVKGEIKIRVPETPKFNKVREIPIRIFASKYTNKGTDNPAYESVYRVMTEFKSIAAVGEAEADRIRTTGSIEMNEYYGKNGNLVSFPRVSASFFNKVNKTDMKPTATFTMNFVVGSSKEEIVNDETTGRIIVNGAIVKYGEVVDIVPFYAESERAIDGVQSWEKDDTVVATGELNFTTKTEVKVQKMGFGDDIEKTYTTSVSELIITGGNGPLEGDFAVDIDEMRQGIARRKARLDELKNMPKAPKAKAPKAPKAEAEDLGF